MIHTPLPGVYERPALAVLAPPVPGLLVEQRGDPAARVGRVDHVVDLAVGGHVDALPALVGGGDELLEDALALLLVLDRVELAAHAQAHGSLEAHAAELGGWPGDGEQRCPEAAAGHRLGAP